MIQMVLVTPSSFAASSTRSTAIGSILIMRAIR